MQVSLASDFDASSSRSCDRCFMLKTKCDLAVPCGRCHRLGVDCRNQRPVRNIGRPKKVKHQRRDVVALANDHNAVTSSLDKKSSDSEDIVLLIPSLPIARDAANALLDKLLLSLPSLGLLSILSKALNTDSVDTATSTGRERPIPVGSDLACVLLAIALETCPQDALTENQGDLDSHIKSLRDNALLIGPDIAKPGAKIQLGTVLTLLLLSYTWCMASDLHEASETWNSLAAVAFVRLCRNMPDPLPEVYEEALQQARFGIRFQALTISLLLHRRCPSDLPLDFGYGKAAPRPRERALCADSLSMEDISIITFVDLFEPLISILGRTLDDIEIGSAMWFRVQQSLEDYYLNFPPYLLKFENLFLPCQCEAMIWLHGLYISLYVGRDIVNILAGRRAVDDKVFGQSLEHSLLLAEVLPFLIKLDPVVKGVLPATAFFIMLSSAVLARALGQFSSFNATPLVNEIKIPQTLLKSIHAHLQVLSALERHGRRFSSLLIGEMRKILLNCYLTRVIGIQSELGEDGMDQNLGVLASYRWCGMGSGLLKMSDVAAQTEWQLNRPRDAELWAAMDSEDRSRLIAVIDTLCAPGLRLCEEGYLDLTIILR